MLPHLWFHLPLLVDQTVDQVEEVDHDGGHDVDTGDLDADGDDTDKNTIVNENHQNTFKTGIESKGCCHNRN